MSSPFFSICIPVYNGEKTLGRTIQSVLDQDFTDFELCVIDNASTDQTQSVISLFDDSRLRIVRNPTVVPAHENWSRAIEMARGCWTKLICADDVLLPSALQQIAKEIDTYSNARIICGTRNVIDEMGNQLIRRRTLVRQTKAIDVEEFRRKILRIGSNPLGEPICWTWDSKLTAEIGRFSPEWHYFIDLDFWIRLASRTQVLVSPIHIGSFRVSRNSWTTSLGVSTISEAIRFFWKHPSMTEVSLRNKTRGSLMAVARGVARLAFLQGARVLAFVHK